MKNSFAPVFSKLLDSSLWEEDYVVRLLFISMLVLQDSDHVVRYNSYALHKRSNIPLDEVEKALKVLKSPDKRRPGQEHDGRRIIEVEDGWLMVNGQFYEEQMRKLSRQAYQAKKQREYRFKKKSMPSPGEKQFVAMVENGEDVSLEPGNRIAAPAARDTMEKDMGFDREEAEEELRRLREET